MSDTDFENVRRQIGCCGIWCGSCIVGNGALAEITRRYKHLIDRHSLREWGPQDVDYDQLDRGLRSIQAMISCKGCRKGGGRDDCELRACASARGLASCTECSDRGTARCAQAELLEHMRTGAVRAGLLIKEAATGGPGGPGEPSGPDKPGADDAGLIEAWTEQLHSLWPQSLLFDGQDDRW